MLKLTQLTIPSGSYQGNVVNLYEPIVPYIGTTPIREVYDSNHNIIYKSGNVENDYITRFLNAGTYTWDTIKNGNYGYFIDNIVETSLLNMSGNDANYYADRNVRDYIKYLSNSSTPITTKEAWTALPSPIAVNASDGDTVRVQYKNKTIDYPSNGRCTLIYNLVPGCQYTISVLNNNSVVSTETITTTGSCRMCNLGLIRNVRDIGGMLCYDNNGNNIGSIAYERIIRGANPAGMLAYKRASEKANTVDTIADDLNTLKNVLGVNVEYDLSVENNFTISGITQYKGSTYGWDDENIYIDICTNRSTHAKIKTFFEIITTELENNNTIYVHCEGGMDRTGLMCACIEAVCGVTMDRIIKDWEMSSYTYSRALDENTGTCLRIDVSSQLLYWIKFLHNTYGTNNESFNTQVKSWLTDANAINLSESVLTRLKNALVI